jgi:nitrous oxidase accessory protein NosD
MNKQKCVMLLVASVLLMLSPMVFGGARLLIVSPTDGDFQRIQHAIDAAEHGGVIVIRPGTYRENLTIDRPLTLLGREGVFLEPEDTDRPAIAIDRTETVTIRGLRIRMATVAMDILNSSCTILDCSISASETGIQIVAFNTDAVSILSTVFRSGSQGVGVSVVGSGVTMFVQCEFSRLGTAILVGGLGTTVVQGCTLESCFDAVVASNTTHTVLAGNTIRGNYANGIRLDRVPSAVGEGTLCLIGNMIEDNGHWGITLCGLHGTDDDASFGRIVGVGNTFSGNERGPVCPEALPLPEGFILP